MHNIETATTATQALLRVSSGKFLFFKPVRLDFKDWSCTLQIDYGVREGPLVGKGYALKVRFVMQLKLNMQQLLPYIQTIERLLLDAWRVCKTTPKTPKQAIIEFSYQIYTHAQPPLYRCLPEKAEIILMEQLLLDEYPFSSDFPFTREQMRQAIQMEGDTF